MNCTLNVAVLFGFNVCGNASPDNEKPSPVREAALIVTGAVPAEVRVTEYVAPVLRGTFPKDRFVELILRVGTYAFRFRVKFSEFPLALAVSVTDWVARTDDAFAVNGTLFAFAGIVTVAGTLTALLLLDRFTLKPPLGAAPLIVTVHASVPVPVIDPVAHAIALRFLLGWEISAPIPLRPITIAPSAEASVAIVN